MTILEEPEDPPKHVYLTIAQRVDLWQENINYMRSLLNSFYARVGCLEGLLFELNNIAQSVKVEEKEDTPENPINRLKDLIENYCYQYRAIRAPRTSVYGVAVSDCLQVDQNLMLEKTQKDIDREIMEEDEYD